MGTPRERSSRSTRSAFAPVAFNQNRRPSFDCRMYCAYAFDECVLIVGDAPIARVKDDPGIRPATHPAAVEGQAPVRMRPGKDRA